MLALNRPGAVYSPADGLLRIEQFQMCYATNDMDRARAFFEESLGIKKFQRLEGELPSGGYIHIELAWVGNTMYELLTARGTGTELYMDRLPTDRFAIKHHHLGFFVPDQAAWDALQVEITRSGRQALNHNNTPGFMEYCFVDVPELGHYLEYLFPEPAGVAFFESVPAN